MQIKLPKDFLVKCQWYDDCLLYSGQPSQQYGRYQGELAHRASWRIHHGAIPEGQVIHHRCFNKRCVNPDHLELTDQLTNIVRNVQQHRSGAQLKLTPRQVIEIYRSDTPEQELSDQYGVSRTTIRRIRNL